MALATASLHSYSIISQIKKQLTAGLVASIVLFSALVSFPVYANETIDNRVFEIVSRLRNIGVMTGSFVQERQLVGMSKPLSAEGEFVFWREQGLYQETQKPFFNAFSLVGDQLINWTEDGKGEVVKEQSALVQREINKTLLSFFNADIELIQQRFEVEWTFLENNRWALKMTPRIAAIAKQMKKVELHGDVFVSQLDVFGANGDITRLIFSSQKESQYPTRAQCEKFYIDAALACEKFSH